MRKICTEISDEFDDFALPDTKKNRDKLTIYWNYLKNSFGIHSTLIEKHFTKIKNHKEIRNKITHENGMFEEQELHKVAPQNFQGMSFRKIGNILTIEITDIQFLLNLLEYINTFITKLIESVDNRYQQIKSK